MMVDYLMKAFKERVNQMDWLSDFSKQSSIEKVNAIVAHSAYPEGIFNNDYVNGLYSRVSKDSTKNALVTNTIAMPCIHMHTVNKNLLNSLIWHHYIIQYLL